jgi:hypothetical protein
MVTDRSKWPFHWPCLVNVRVEELRVDSCMLGGRNEGFSEMKGSRSGMRLLAGLTLIIGSISLPAPDAVACHDPWAEAEVCIYDTENNCHVIGIHNPLKPGRPAPVGSIDPSCIVTLPPQSPP